jgi:hypothetical protein
MCPVCVRTLVTSATLIAGTTSGLAALVIGKVRVKKIQKKEKPNGQ